MSTTPLPQYAIIVAGGSGTRMQAALPKQFLELRGLPVLMHTILRFHEYNPAIRLIIVLPEAQQNTWRELCEKHHFRLFHLVVNGGATRFQSVKSGLSMIHGAGVVAVHDGVRPLIDTATIAKAFGVAAEKGNAVVAVPLKDSIRQVKREGQSVALNRQEYQLVQTPQCFQAELLRQAYEQEETENFTDDASVVEQLGVQINLVEGSYRNLKITTPEDMVIAEALLGSEQ